MSESDTQGHELVQQNPGVVAASKESVDVLLHHRFKQREASSCCGVTKAELSVLIVAADVDITFLGTSDTVVQTGCDELDLFVAEVLDQFRLVYVLAAPVP